MSIFFFCWLDVKRGPFFRRQVQPSVFFPYLDLFFKAKYEKKSIFRRKVCKCYFYIFFCLNKKNTILHSFVRVRATILVWSRDNHVIFLGVGCRLLHSWTNSSTYTMKPLDGQINQDILLFFSLKTVAIFIYKKGRIAK